MNRAHITRQHDEKQLNKHLKVVLVVPRGAPHACQNKGMDFLLCLETTGRSTVEIKFVLLKEKIE